MKNPVLQYLRGKKPSCPYLSRLLLKSLTFAQGLIYFSVVFLRFPVRSDAETYLHIHTPQSEKNTSFKTDFMLGKNIQWSQNKCTLVASTVHDLKLMWFQISQICSILPLQINYLLIWKLHFQFKHTTYFIEKTIYLNPIFPFGFI